MTLMSSGVLDIGGYYKSRVPRQAWRLWAVFHLTCVDLLFGYSESASFYSRLEDVFLQALKASLENY